MYLNRNVYSESARVILAFYSPEEGHAQSAFQTLEGTEKVCLAGSGASKLTAACNRYRALLPDSESLLVIETVAGRIESVVKALRLEG